MNKGLTDTLSKSFTDLILVKRPIVELTKIDNMDWLTGFVDGEGCFVVNIAQSQVSVGYRVGLVFTITQHIRDHKLLETFANYFDCGWIFVNSNKPIVCFIVSKLSDILEKIIPFFLKYPLISAKSQDFNCFVEVALLMKKKAHLSKEGLEQIRSIKLKMNRNRKEAA